jgi:hypothetical protein
MTGFAVRRNNETGESTLAEVADAVDTALTTSFRALMPTTDTLGEIAVTSLGLELAQQYTKTKNLGGTRTVGNASVPKGICPVLGLRTTYAIRSARGWMFLPSLLDSGTISNGLINTGSAIWGAIDTFGAALLGLAGDTAGPGTIDPGVWSQTRFVRDLDPFFFALTGYVRRQKPHWLRSRSLLEQ